MKPIRNKVFAEILPPPQRESGIILRNNETLDKYRAKVIAVGPDVKYVKQGDVVRYNENEAVPYEENGKKFVFLRETFGNGNGDIIAVL
jgi:co-chaperonin GroES (HSP10)